MLSLYAGNGTHQIDVTSFVFKGGEVQVKAAPQPSMQQWGVYDFKSLQIRADIRNSDDIMGLLMLTDAARREFGRLPITLEMPYVPYARQDRVCAPGEALSIKVFADLINSQGYDLVRIWDPHSDVTTALIDNCEVIKAYQFARRAIDTLKAPRENLILVSPDAGANKKVFEAAQYMRVSTVVRADKTRNPMTGAITGTVVYSEHVGDKDFFILDDICDGGRTFVELAKVLKPLTRGKIYLFVTHGIFSAGFDTLKQHIDHIYTANSFADLRGEDFVTQVTL